MFSMEVVPTVAEPTRRPSTSTSVCAGVGAAEEDARRAVPGPPVPRNSTRACALQQLGERDGAGAVDVARA